MMPVTVALQRSTFRLPDAPATPIIMVAVGSGIAPFRAFIKERAGAHSAWNPSRSMVAW